MNTVQWNKYEPVLGQVLNSAIGLPKEGTILRRGEQVYLKGYAYGDGNKGTQASRVQLSFDDGESWIEVPEENLVKEKKAPNKKVFSWTLWRFKLDTSQLKGDSVTVMVRAIGSDGEVQQYDIRDLYNIRGIMNNSHHKVSYKIQ